MELKQIFNCLLILAAVYIWAPNYFGHAIVALLAIRLVGSAVSNNKSKG